MAKLAKFSTEEPAPEAEGPKRLDIEGWQVVPGAENMQNRAARRAAGMRNPRKHKRIKLRRP